MISFCYSRRFPTLIFILLALSSTVRADQNDRELALEAQRILKAHCYSCHGVNFNGSAQFNVMDREGLIENGYLVPHDVEASLLLERIRSEEMPPEDSEVEPLSEQEIGTLSTWIGRGAPQPERISRGFKTYPDLIVEIYNDLRKADRNDRPYYRYFSLVHLGNNYEHVSDFDLRLYAAALSKTLNSLSYEPELYIPSAIDEEGTIFRIDMRELGWNEGLWKSLINDYPYGFHFKNNDDQRLAGAAEQIEVLSNSKLCWIRADWFVNIATRPPVYDRFLELPSEDAALEKRLNVDFVQNFLHDRLARAGFASSGVSKGNRLLERHPASFGYYWKSYDFKNKGVASNLFRLPLGPPFEKNPFPELAFRHDGGEMIFSLPNGLQGYMLTDDSGRKIDVGPIEVVRDSKETAGTPEVVNGLSCMHCHRHGLIDFKDSVRSGSGVFDIARKKVINLYTEPAVMQEKVDADRERFLSALEKTIGPFLLVGEDAGKSTKELAEPIGAIARFYQRDLDISTVGSELGLQDDDAFRKILEANPLLSRIGLGPLANSATIKRSEWESTQAFVSPFQETMRILGLATPVN